MMTISVIVPVLQEEAAINRAICRLLAMASEKPVEILVVDGDSEATTLRAMTSDAVKGIISEKGRGKQMNAGAAAASGDVLLFLHCDTELPADGLQRIVAVMEKGDVVGGAFDLGIEGSERVFRAIERVASLRSRLTRLPYGDQAIFLRRDCFIALGGYREWPIMEDVDLMRRVKKAGGRICLIDERVKTSARRWRKEGIIACTLRNWTIMTLYVLGASPEKLAKWRR